MAYKNSDVTIVIPNWNGSHLLRKHLPVVLEHAKGVEIILVDDGSTDDSVSMVHHVFPEIRVITKPTHEGFSSTVNAGVSHVKTPLVVLLNSDIEPEEHFLLFALGHFDDPNLFAVGCMDKSVENGKVTLRGRGIARFHKGFYVHSRGEVNFSDTAWISGGSGAFRKSMWDKLGGMDPLYNPFYWEDIDLSYRALKAGYSILFESKSIVVHKHEEGSIKQSYSDTFIKQIAFRNQCIFMWKNISDPVLLLSHVFWVKVRIVQLFLKGDMTFLLGFIRAQLCIPGIVVHRIQQQKMWKKSDREIITNKNDRITV